MVGQYLQADDHRPVRQRHRTPVDTAIPALHTRHGVSGQEPPQPGWCERLADSEFECDGTAGGTWCVGGTFGTQSSGRLGEHLAHRVVELPDAGEARGKCDVRHRHRGALNEHPRGGGPVGPGQGEWSGADLFTENPPELAWGVPEVLGQAVHPAPVHDAVLDQSHGTRGEVGVDVPARRTRDGIGEAATAGAIAVLLGGRGGQDKRDIAGLGRDGRARWPAIDAGGAHRHEELTVEPGVACL